MLNQLVRVYAKWFISFSPESVPERLLEQTKDWGLGTSILEKTHEEIELVAAVITSDPMHIFCFGPMLITINQNTKPGGRYGVVGCVFAGI
jgi:hypothetical protein